MRIATKLRRLRCWMRGHRIRHWITIGRYRDALGSGPTIVEGYYRCDCGHAKTSTYERSIYE